MAQVLTTKKYVRLRRPVQTKARLAKAVAQSCDPTPMLAGARDKSGESHLRLRL